MAEFARDRMRCSSFVGKAERQLWRSRGADALKFAFIHGCKCCRALIETHLSRSALAQIIPERVMLVQAAPAAGQWA
jgi:hypothetical protein